MSKGTTKTVDVAVIGAGSAGLTAVKEARKYTDSYALLHHGPTGTTCARVGCMPSKVLIHVANDFHRREVFAARGILGAESLRVNLPKVLEHTRSLRDRYVRGVLQGMESLQPYLVEGLARFVDARTLQVGDQQIQAKRTVIATGSTPFVPQDWNAFGGKVLTSDTLFEQTDLPQSIAVVGLGAIGLELGLALSRLGIRVEGFQRAQNLGGLSDPVVLERAKEVFSREFPIHFGQDVVAKDAGADGVLLKAGSHEARFSKVLAAMGRRPNLSQLGLEAAGVKLGENGQPDFDPTTLRIRGTNLFIAGDVNGFRPILHEAADEGKIAGFNAAHDSTDCFQRRVPMGIVFSEPNLAFVGLPFKDLPRDRAVFGQVDFRGQGRALAGALNEGILRVYADKGTGRLLGAEMMAPQGEHLAHLLALALHKKMTVFELLQIPFYHPVLEEGLRTALRDLAENVESKPQHLDLLPCEPSGVEELS